MTEREQKLIDAYIPSPRDTTLGDFEYYVEDLSGRIQRVEITDILPLLNDSDETIYLVVQSTTRKRVKGWGEYGGFTKGYNVTFVDKSSEVKKTLVGQIHESKTQQTAMRRMQESQTACTFQDQSRQRRDFYGNAYMQLPVLWALS